MPDRSRLGVVVRTISWCAIGMTTGLALLVIIEQTWTGASFFARLGAELPAMVTSTSLSILLIALALALQDQSFEAARKLSLALFCAAMGISVLSLVLASQDTSALRSDRMANATVAAILTAGFAEFALRYGNGRGRRIHAWLTTCGLVAMGALIAAYLVEPGAIWQLPFFGGMSLPSALCFAMIFAAQLLVGWQDNWVGDLFGTTAGAQSARRLLPLALACPAALTGFFVASSRVQDVPTASLHLAINAVVIFAMILLALVLSARFRDSRESELQRLTGVIDEMAEMAMVFDEEGQLVAANQLAWEFAPEGEAPDVWFRKSVFFSPGNMDVLTGNSHPAAMIGNQHSAHQSHVGWMSPAGDQVTLRFSSIHFAGKRPLTVISISDESEDWQARDNLARIERLDALGLMAGNVAHEFANIIAAIQLTADTGMLGSYKPAARSFEAIAHGCGRATELTDRLANLSRTRSVDAVSTDLTRCLRYVEILARKMQSEQIGIRFEIPDRPVHSKVEPNELEAVLLNLLRNANNAIVQSRKEKGHITLSLAEGDGKVTISVVDNGLGMDTATLLRATEPFFTTREDEGGTGLGLSMVDAFATRSAGSFTLHSALNVGTTAKLSIPTCSPARDKVGSELGRTHRLEGLRILVVEDDPQFRDVLPESLRRLGVRVAAASSVVEAMGVLRTQGPFDAMLTDMHLPLPGDGKKLATLARESFPLMPVIFMTGYSGIEASTDADVGGIVLRKPIRLKTLANAFEILTLRGQASEISESKLGASM